MLLKKKKCHLLALVGQYQGKYLPLSMKRPLAYGLGPYQDPGLVLRGTDLPSAITNRFLFFFFLVIVAAVSVGCARYRHRRRETKV